MKIPGDVYGRDFANHLIRKWNFHQLRQTGSHIILRSEVPAQHTVSIPAHKPLKKGTLRGLVTFVAERKQVSPADVLEKL
jgi:predicted RNA binding protein YcfA (HicA-like mRNA interferase family)